MLTKSGILTLELQITWQQIPKNSHGGVDKMIVV
ncbi:hypothetical protein COLO4_24130 [Corchorus olitorius]|uniref:Uncharacterized protein n=1 Tax=Corchorus olitorius TaxID=93759 RepID=A0A1R3ICN6_9ROSI|nr:hypothetical protein COLO4_24130 [Corchorus olitorius]